MFWRRPEIALSCHIRIASQKSLFAFPEINQELLPGLGGLSKAIELAGKLNALKLVLSGDTINANTALDLKLVDEPDGSKECPEVALHLLREITAGRSLKIIHAVMSSIHNSRRLPYEDALIKDAELFCELALEEANRRKNNE
ncbi:MAG: enoyl-CoA hydratase-related protein [Bacteroidales bacterium]